MHAGAIVVMCPPEHESDTETTESEDGSRQGSMGAGPPPETGINIARQAQPVAPDLFRPQHLRPAGGPLCYGAV